MRKSCMNWIKIMDETRIDQFDRKMRALRCHVSQHQHPDEMEQSVRMWNSANAQLGGLPDGRLAERFLAVDAR